MIHSISIGTSNSSHVVGHHDGEECLVGGVDGHVDGGGLQQHEQRVREHVRARQQEVERQTDRVSLPVQRLGRRPVQRVDRVLAERREQTVADLKKLKFRKIRRLLK